MNATDHQRLPLSGFILALSTGAFSCLALATVLVVLGVSQVETCVFAGLGGFIISCFVWIERSLLAQVKHKERMLALEVASNLNNQNQLYSRSLACLVRFDATTLIIDQASPGFVKMLRMSADSMLSGRRLEDILHVNSLKLESVVDAIKKGDSSLKQPKMEISSADGCLIHALISGQYVQDGSMIEAAFFVPPVSNTERFADLEATQKYLDRFRKGMFRRETRILELKEEVNIICREMGMATRYQTDNSSDDNDRNISLSQLANTNPRKERVS